MATDRPRDIADLASEWDDLADDFAAMANRATEEAMRWTARRDHARSEANRLRSSDRREEQ